MSERMPTTPCSRCARPIGWCVTDNGRPMPIDPEPDPAGNVICEYRDGRLHGTVLLKGEPRPSGVAFMPHFATCPKRVVKPKRVPKPTPEPVPDLFSGGTDD